MMEQSNFPENVLAEADSVSISYDVFTSREEVRGVTIDSQASLDLDDAIDVDRSPDGFVIHVSIADVSSCVRRGTSLFDEALKRVATRYLKNENVPMLPRNISEDKLSLVENQRRPALTFSVTLSTELEVVKTDVRKTVLTNRRKLNYAQVDYIIDSCPDDPDYHFLNECYILARRLLENRRQRGALVIYDLQRLLFTNEEGQIIKMKPEDAHKSNIVVQEFMILANSAVAELAAERDYVFLFRNHAARQAAPKREDILEQLRTANSPRLLDSLSRRVDLWFDRAKYDPVLKGHYGLNLPAYTHVTSPLRRIPDLINHDLLKAQLSGDELDTTVQELYDMAAKINAVILHDIEQRKKYFKERALKETGGKVKWAGAIELAALSAGELRRVLTESCRSKILSEDLEKTLMDRFERQDVGVELLAPLLFEADDNAEGWKKLREKAIETALSNVGFSDQLLNFHIQNGRLAGFKVDIKEYEGIFAARIVAMINENEYSTPSYSIGSNKKMAQHAAANEFLTGYLKNSLVPSNQTSEPVFNRHEKETTLKGRLEEAMVDDAEEKNIDEPAEFDENYVGQLMELCVSRKYSSMPAFEFSQSGTSNAPKITCVCTLRIGDEIVQVSGISSNKKRSKQIAAKKMLDETLRRSMEKLLSKGIGTTDAETEASRNPEDKIEENYIGILGERCVKSQWPMPVYQFSSSGQSNLPVFTCKVSVKKKGGVVTAAATASTKKNAKQLAAKEMLNQLG